LAAACSSGPKECKPDDATTCGEDQVCEAVQGGTPAYQCFAPVLLEGRVYDLNTLQRHLRRDGHRHRRERRPGRRRGADGQRRQLELRVPSTRTDSATGAFVPRKVRLRSQARNYVPFPSGARISLPIDTSAATAGEDGGPYVLKTPQTEVGLSPVEAGLQNLPSVGGTVELSADQRSVLLALEGPRARP
jgi:hypothetical protein